MFNIHILVFQHHYIFIFYKCARSCSMTNFQFTVDFRFSFALVYMMTSHTKFNSDLFFNHKKYIISTEQQTFQTLQVGIFHINTKICFRSKDSKKRKLLRSNIKFNCYDIFHTSTITVTTYFFFCQDALKMTMQTNLQKLFRKCISPATKHVQTKISNLRRKKEIIMSLFTLEVRIFLYVCVKNNLK